MNNINTIAFIGGGNMARCLIGGLIKQKFDPKSIFVTDPNLATRNNLAHDFNVSVFDNAEKAVLHADIWVFAVKPQIMQQVCHALKETAQQIKPLIITIAAGITTDQMDEWLGGDLSIVRAMPNTPALLGAGITGLFANSNTQQEEQSHAQYLMETAGKTIWFDIESDINAVTAISGSGPAYVFAFAEALLAASKAEGLSATISHALVLQTLQGAVQMMAASSQPISELRESVTSPGGTTQAALSVMQAAGFNTIIANAVHAAAIRSEELSDAYNTQHHL